jgi:hypothetical protein
MLDISHLVIIGCSFSYGDSLANPKEDSWPGILSKKLNVPIVNLSSRGGGNDRIMRRLYEYHYLNSSKNNNPFYILPFSHSSRREEYIRAANDYMVMSMKPDPVLMKKQTYSSLFILNHDSFISARKKLMVRSYVSDFLNNNNMNYLVTDFMPDSEDEIQSLREIYPIVYEKIYTDKYRLKNLNEISIKYPRLPCGHDGVEAQLEIGNYVHDELIARYNEPIVKQQDYTTLRQYIDHYDSVGSKGDIAWL